MPSYDEESPTVLVADDEPYIRSFLDVVLTQAGLRVLFATNGREAIELFNNNRGLVDAVLLDVNMPLMGGVETMRRLRKLAPDLPCCLMAGDSSDHEMCEMVDSGEADFLSKPFSLPGLAAEIQNLVMHVAVA